MRMYGKSVLLLAGLFVWMLAFSSTPADAYTGWYWCGGGDRVLQVQGTKVRCWIQATRDNKKINPCLPGQVYKKDYNGNKDKCVTGIGSAAVVMDPGCPANYTLNPKHGKDNCQRTFPARSEAPKWKK